MKSEISTPQFRSATLNALFAALPALHELPEPQAQLVRAFRLTVLFGKAGKCPIAHIAPMIGGVASAAQFVRVVHVLGAHWHDAIRIYRPCCPQISPDEILLLNLINAMVLRDAAAFRAMVRDILDEAATAAVQTEIAAFTANHIRPRHAI